MCIVPSLYSVVFSTSFAWVFLPLCKEEGSSPASAIIERAHMGLSEVPLPMTWLCFESGLC